MAQLSTFNPVIIIPCYRHAFKLARNLDKILSLGLPLIIVDDGSPVPDAVLMHEWSNTKDQILIISNQANLGKGASMVKALKKARDFGYSHALQIDADGQIDYALMVDFFNLAQRNPTKLICGEADFSNVPKARYYGRFITHFWVMLELGKFEVIDTMCGVRVYPLKETCKVLDKRRIGAHMEYDTEIFVRLYWSGMDYLFKKVDVSYPKYGISNFRMIKDNLAIAKMHAYLCCTKLLHYWAIRKRSFI